jgi:tRNA A-37 threonylcarbamoyl transferase component Bud32
LRGKSYFITEYLNGQDLGSYLNEHQSDTKACERMAKNTLALFKSMTKLRIIQGDLKMTNILVRNHKPYLIDFDGAQEYFSQLALRRAFKNEITRFMQNWQNLPTIHALFDRLKNDEILT